MSANKQHKNQCNVQLISFQVALPENLENFIADFVLVGTPGSKVYRGLAKNTVL